MTAENAVTVETLQPQVDYLRLEGLATFDVRRVPQIAALAVECGYAVSESAVTTEDVRRLMSAALGVIDRDELKSSAARLFGLGKDDHDKDDDYRWPLEKRTKNAAAATKPKPLTVRGYRGNRTGRSRQTADLQQTADNLHSMWVSALQRRAGMPVDSTLR